MATLDPQAQRRFATEVVAALRREGHVAYWAGGCVRDQVLGRTPKDYDVATSATPPQIQAAFGRRRTLEIGAAFGVVTVIGPPGAGQIEVATFRRDEGYADGRRPDRVVYSDAEEDARRRDFTINGMFFDPVDGQVIDLVGGQEDLRTGRVRAIGEPAERFTEDKLRMLRAVRFAAGLGFELEERTREAICRMAPQVSIVSAERIAQEMRGMLVGAGRSTAMQMLLETGLLVVVLPEATALDGNAWEHTLRTLEALREPGFPLALAALLHETGACDQVVRDVARRWRLSNDEGDRAAWLVERRGEVAEARRMPVARLKRLLASEGIAELLALEEACTLARGSDSAALEHCRELLRQPRESLDPPPLVTGEDLIRLGVPRGPVYKRILDEVRDAQLEGQVATREEAISLVERIVRSGSG